MSEQTRGLILRTRLFSETSVIVHWLTRDFGRLSTIAKGARRAKSPFRGKLDLFYLADFSYARNRRSDLHTLCEVGLLATHNELRPDLARLQQACYCAALIEQTTETDTPMPAIFDLGVQVLEHLCGGPPQPRTIFAFELKLLRELGLSPDVSTVSLRGGAKKLLESLTNEGWEAIARMAPTPAEVLELRQFLHGFLIYHLGKLPPGRSTALKARKPGEIDGDAEEPAQG